MHRKLLMIACLLISSPLLAQKNYEAFYKEGKAETKLPKDADKTDYRSVGSPLSEFSVEVLPMKYSVKDKDEKHPEIPGKTLTNKDVAYDGNLLMMMFNPSCGHCEEMTKMLEQHIDLFHKSKLLMVATGIMGPYMPMFQNGLKTNEYDPIMIGIDKSYLIERTYSYRSLPQINIYDKDRKLIKWFCGETPIDSLKKYIE